MVDLRRSVVLGIVLALAGCAGPEDRAEDAAHDLVDRVEQSWSLRARTGTEAESLAVLAQGEAKGAHGQGDVERVDVLSWSGGSGGTDVAQVRVRVREHLEAVDGYLFEKDEPESDASVCYLLTLTRQRFGSVEVRCPDHVVARSPMPAADPELPTDTDAVIRHVLGGDDGAAVVEDEAERRLPHTRVAARAGRGRVALAVGVGIVGSDDCVVGVREADGRVELRRDFPREWLQPGELGCSPDLVLNPPT